MWQVVNNRDSTRTVNYTYDALNRIASGFTTGNRWGTSYAIDAWGNLYQKNPVSGKLATDPLTQTVTTKNQFSGFCYDLAGNLLGQSGCPGLPYTPTYSYDAENRMTTTAGVTYSYDGDGKRVKKSSGTLYWTGMGSDALDETDLAGTLQREYVYFNGKRVARLTPPSTVRYFYSDHLGSHDLVTSATGAIQEESDYHPYGEEAVIVDTLSTQPYKFTGKERDSESGLDNFGARYDASSLGRFMTPDDSLVYWDRSDPQSLNLYSYVENNPVSNTDPDGHDCVYLNNAGNGVESVDQRSSSGECGNSGGYWVNGAVTNAQIDQNSVTLTGTTNGVDNNTSASYLTNGDVPLNSFAQQSLGLAGQMAAPGVNLAAKGLMAFGWMYSAPAMLLATCASGGPGCNGPSMAMAVLPGVGALREGAVLFKEGAAFGKGAEILQKAGGMAQAAKDYESLQGVEAVYGSTKVKTLADGTKAVLYESTGGSGAPTLALQNAAGRTVTKIRY